VASILSLSLAAALIASDANAAEIIRCLPIGGGAPVTVSLAVPAPKGSVRINLPMNCLKGSFVEDLTPCAPTDMFSLSAPTGGAEIVRIVSRWQDYMTHTGGVFHSHVDDTEISFSAGFEFDSFEEWWTFTIDRPTGQGTLRGPKVTEASYTCSKVGKKV
jgi:hypothetical protein